MKPEQQRIAIARAVGLKLVIDSGLTFAELYRIDGYSHNSGRLQHIVDAWVSTDRRINPDGVWGHGSCSQAVLDKAIAEKWAAEWSGERTVVAVKKCLDVPDYLNSLDAMHEAEKVLTYTPDFMFYLRFVVGGFSESQCEWCDYNWFNVAHATAAQRGKALLHALNLWVED